MSSILSGLLLFSLVASYLWAATIVRRRNRVREALASLDVHLRARNDRIASELALSENAGFHENLWREQVELLCARVSRRYDSADPNAVREHLECARLLDSAVERGIVVSAARLRESKGIDSNHRDSAIRESGTDAFRSDGRSRDQSSSERALPGLRSTPELDDQIAAARRSYNAAVRDLRNAIEIFPGSLLAQLTNARPFPFDEDPREAAPLSEKLDRIASERRQVLERVVLTVIGGVVLGRLGVELEAVNGLGYSLLGAIALGTLSWFSWRTLTRLRDQARTATMVAACEPLGLSFTPDVCDYPIGRCRRDGLIPGYDRAFLTDRIFGTHQGVEIDLCEAELEDTYEERDTTFHKTVFRGILVNLSFPKSLTGRTIIRGDDGALFNFLDRSVGQWGERVSLESPEFERLYEVYATDQVEARRLLTPVFMDRLVELAHRFDSPPQMALAGDSLALALPSSRRRFDGFGRFARFEDPRHVQRIQRELRLLLDVIGLIVRPPG